MMERLLEIALAALLMATLFHAIRLERALGVLKRDRGALETLVSSFNESTAQAELGIERLRSASEGAGRQIARQIETGAALRQDLAFLIERGDTMADRLDRLVRGARVALEGHVSAIEPTEPPQRLRSQAERDLVKALKLVR